MFKVLVFCLLFTMGVSLQAEDNAQTHKELHSILVGLENSINAQKYSELAQYFDKNLRVTTINQEVITSQDQIEKYFNGWFGKGKFLASLKIKLKADDLTKLYDNNHFGVVTGSGDESYILSDGRSFDMKTRWTATVVKETDGDWKILTLHIGTNFLDNPLLSAAKKSALYIGFAGVVVGLLLGLLLGFILRRIRK